MLRFLIAFAALAVSAGTSRAAAVSLDAFNYAKPAAIWRPIAPAPAPTVATGGGVAFACPFNQDVDRVCWDRDVSLDLSGYSSLALELSCESPTALRGLGVYVRSGKGWYVWNKPLTAAGRQVLLLNKTAFTSEGSPAGWNRIDKLRLSPWRGSPLAATITLHRLTATKDEVLVLRAGKSAPSDSERAYAARVCNRVSRLLGDRGIAHAVQLEDDAAAAIQAAAVVVLPYNPDPPAAELAALKRCIEKGGKLIVFYGSGAGLAALMDVKVGDYLFSEDFSRWRSFAFTEPGKWHVPAEIYQKSQSLRPVHPASARGQVIAWWRDASGRRRPEPAWVATDRGLWMSHVLLDDDVEDKSRLLLGLIGSLHPPILADAARHALLTTGKVDSYADFDRAAAGIEHLAAELPARDAVSQRIAVAREARRRMHEFHRAGEYRSALDCADLTQSTLVEAYSLAQRPLPGEFRGVWDHDGVGWYPGNWDATCRILSERGINAVFPNLLWGGLAHFQNRTIPTSATMRMYGDQAAAVTKSARKYGLQSHLWVVCFNAGNAPPEFVKRLQKEGRMQTTVDGRATTWLNPADTRNQDMLIAAMREAVLSNAFDGVHLDYVRYPGKDYDFSPTTRHLFEASLGRKVERWPADVAAGGKLRPTFVTWRAAQVTAFVRRTREALRATNPKIRLSAAVWGGYPDTIASIGQDWATWIRNGYVDFVCPMNYSESLYQYSALVQKQLALPNAAGRIYSGIGVTADESQLQPDEVIEQIVHGRRLGANGFMLFDLTHTLRDETLPALSRGATAR